MYKRQGQAGEATEATSVALGEGLVHFVPTPVELSAREALSDLYRSFLVDAGIPHTPAEQPLQALKPTADGLTVLLNPQNEPTLAVYGGIEAEIDVYKRQAYTNESPNWGNLTRDVDIPNEVTAIGIDIRKHSSGPGAAMHLWLMEEDGDAWVAQLRPDGRSLGAVPEALYRVVVPVASFQFEPRGPGTRDMPSTSRMLLGCNFDDLEVTVEMCIRDRAYLAAMGRRMP